MTQRTLEAAGVPATPFSAYTMISLASGVLAGRLNISPMATVAIGIGVEFLRDPSDSRGRTQALYDLTTYMVGFAVGVTMRPASSPPPKALL